LLDHVIEGPRGVLRWAKGWFMFFTYLRRELGRRSKQAIVVAVGIGIGIGLVVTVSAASSGVKTAQDTVLHSLYGVGTDMTVTQSATPGSGGPQMFQFGNGAGQTAPSAGGTINRDTLRVAPGQGTLTTANVATVASLKGVSAASGGLTLTDLDLSGTIPTSGGASGGGTGGGFGSNINIDTFSVTGIDTSQKGVGPLTSSDVSSGRFFTESDNDAPVAVVTSSYASTKNLALNSTLDVGGTTVTVIGIVTLPSSSAGSDVYLPLGEAQTISGLTDKVSTIYVSASSATGVTAVQDEIQKALPNATVTTSASLANQVSGSLSSASNLATNLGKWLAIAALIVAFLVAALLMMSAVARRVRELGTLKALGWRTRRVVGQVMGEGVVQGIAGGIIALAIGILGAELVGVFSPTLSATVGATTATGGGFGGPGSGGGGRFAGGGGGEGLGEGARRAIGGGVGTRFSDLSHTVLVHLSAPIQPETLGIAFALALAGGLIAGAFGSWRAARLQPAAALRRVE
jgi:ABC-type antimicrobial peptide transport system permease subunit